MSLKYSTLLRTGPSSSNAVSYPWYSSARELCQNWHKENDNNKKRVRQYEIRTPCLISLFLNKIRIVNVARWWAFVVRVWMSASQRICLFWHEAHTKSLRARFPTRPEEDEEMQGLRAEQKGVSDCQRGGCWRRSWDLWTQRPGRPAREDNSAFLVAVWEFRSDVRPR